MALELIRRIIGSAKVKDITQIRDKEARAFAEKFCIRLAKDNIFNRGMHYHSRESYIQAIQHFLDVDDHAFIMSRLLYITWLMWRKTTCNKDKALFLRQQKRYRSVDKRSLEIYH